MRGPGWKTLSLTLSKFFRIREGHRIEIRGEAFNLTNTPQFSSPNRSASSATFGEITGAQGDRNVQLALKYSF